MNGNDANDTERVFVQLRDEIRKAKDDYKDEASLYEPPECHYCNRQMKVGSVGGGEIKFGCYRDDCDIKEEESEFAYYSTTRRTAPATAASARLDALLNFCQRLAREARSQDTDTEKRTTE